MNECNGTVEVVQATAEALAAGVHEGVGSRSEDEVKMVVGSMAANVAPKSTAELCEDETNRSWNLIRYKRARDLDFLL